MPSALHQREVDSSILELSVFVRNAPSYTGLTCTIRFLVLVVLCLKERRFALAEN